MTYTFKTVNPEYLGTSYGFHYFQVQADTHHEAWTTVRKLTSLVLTKVKDLAS